MKARMKNLDVPSTIIAMGTALQISKKSIQRHPLLTLLASADFAILVVMTLQIMQYILTIPTKFFC